MAFPQRPNYNRQKLKAWIKDERSAGLSARDLADSIDLCLPQGVDDKDRFTIGVMSRITAPDASPGRALKALSEVRLKAIAKYRGKSLAFAKEWLEWVDPSEISPEPANESTAARLDRMQHELATIAQRLDEQAGDIKELRFKLSTIGSERNRVVHPFTEELHSILESNGIDIVADESRIREACEFSDDADAIADTMLGLVFPIVKRIFHVRKAVDALVGEGWLTPNFSAIVGAACLDPRTFDEPFHLSGNASHPQAARK